jgi:signal peptidase I
MEPGIRAGDKVFVIKEEQYTYGDVIAFEIWRKENIISYNLPAGKKEYRTYRVVGLPGDTVEIKDHFCIINGQPPQTRFIKDTIDGVGYPVSVQEEVSATGLRTMLYIEKPESILNKKKSISDNREFIMLDNLEPVTVPENHYFVLGDNRTASVDSRIIGAVPFEMIKGKVVKRK